MGMRFLTQEGMPRDVVRSAAFGYKRLVIAEDVDMNCPVTVHTSAEDERVLCISRCEADNEEDIYVCLCREFGVVGHASKEMSDLSVLFCDGGWMLVTLARGAMCLYLDGECMMPVVGDFHTSVSSEREISWVNADKLRDYRQYWGTKGMFLEDVEWSFTMCGAGSSFKLRHNSEEDVDLSFGYIAQYERQQEDCENARNASKITNMVMSGTGTDSEMYLYEDEQDFDADDEDDEDYY